MSYYSIHTLKSIGIENSQQLLDWCNTQGCPNELNFLLPSTSGVHGSYCSLDDLAQAKLDYPDEDSSDLTVMIVKPRIVQIIYGTVRVLPGDEEAMRDIFKRSLESVSNFYEGNLPSE